MAGHVRHGKQRLHALDVADADAQAAFLLVDLGHAIGFDGLLNAQTHAMLIDVEKQQLLERGALFDRQFARDAD